MSVRLCPSCDHENPGPRIYCARCGGILSALPIPPQGEPSHPPVRSVSSALVKNPLNRRGNVSLSSIFIGLIKYLLSVAIGVIVVLSVMNPNEDDSRKLQSERFDASAAMERVFADARQGPVELSQHLINDFLKSSPTLPLQSFGPIHPVLRMPHVELFPDSLICDFDVSCTGFEFHFSERFIVRGKSRNWTLEARSASLGLLRIPSLFLPYMTAFLANHEGPAIARLNMMKSADELSIGQGSVFFSLR